MDYRFFIRVCCPNRIYYLACLAEVANGLDLSLRTVHDFADLALIRGRSW